MKIETIIALNTYVKVVILENESAKVVLLSHGAGIYEYQYQGKPLVMKPETVEAYMSTGAFYGKTIGRTSGRLVFPSYQIGDQSYDVVPYLSKVTSLHGGKQGFSNQNFDILTKDESQNKITFRYLSEDLEEGYPGNLTLDVTYQLKKDGSLDIVFDGMSDQDTLCNITNHAYFNLNQAASKVDDTMIQMNASTYLDIDDDYLIKSKKPIQNTPFDFKKASRLGDQMALMSDTVFNGFDHTWLFDEKDDKKVKATAYNPISKVGLDVFSSYPAVVFYTHNSPANLNLDGPFDFKALHSSFTFECQFEPGGIHHNDLNQAILKKDEAYHQFITFKPYIK